MCYSLDELLCGLCSVKIICVNLVPFFCFVLFSFFLHQEEDLISLRSFLFKTGWSQQPRAWMRNICQFFFKLLIAYLFFFFFFFLFKATLPCQLLLGITQLKGRCSLVSKQFWFSTWMQNSHLEIYVFSSSAQTISAPPTCTNTLILSNVIHKSVKSVSDYGPANEEKTTKFYS